MSDVGGENQDTKAFSTSSTVLTVSATRKAVKRNHSLVAHDVKALFQYLLAGGFSCCTQGNVIGHSTAWGVGTESLRVLSPW